MVETNEISDMTENLQDLLESRQKIQKRMRELKVDVNAYLELKDSDAKNQTAKKISDEYQILTKRLIQLNSELSENTTRGDDNDDDDEDNDDNEDDSDGENDSTPYDVSRKVVQSIICQDQETRLQTVANP